MNGILLLLLAMAVAYDLLFRRVPNWLLLVAIGTHAGWLTATGLGLGGIDISTSAIGGIVGIVLFIPLYALRAMGGGDVKFFTVLGLLLGTQALLPIWLIASVLAGVHAVIWYASTRQMAMLPPAWMQFRDRMMESALYQYVLKKREGRHGIPYAAYLAIAALMVANR